MENGNGASQPIETTESIFHFPFSIFPLPLLTTHHSPTLVRAAGVEPAPRGPKPRMQPSHPTQMSDVNVATRSATDTSR